MIRAVLAATALAAASWSCTSFDYTRCGEHVCAPGLACCGDACVPETCGDGELQPAEQCDTWTRRACAASGYDFGTVACTATCALDESACTSFRFRTGGLPCDIAKPAQLAVAGDTLWAGTRLRQIVRADGRGCTSGTLATVPSRVLAMSADEAIAVMNPVALQVIGPAGVADLPFTPLPGVQAAVVIDERTAVLGHGSGLLTIVERLDAGWRARALTLTCPPAGPRRIDALARWDDDLVVVFAAAVSQLGTVPIAALRGEATTATATCTDLLGLPPSPDFNSSPAGDDGIYFIGNATDATTSVVTGLVVRVAPDGDGALVPTILRGAVPTDPRSSHVQSITPIQRGWIDPTGVLHVASRDDALVLRDERWRRLDDPIGRDFGSTVAYRDVSVTATVASALVSRGHGYEIVDDLGIATHPARCTAGFTSCTIAAAGRGHGAAWLLAVQVHTNVTTRAIARDGVPIVRDVAGAPWLPLLLGFGEDGEWIVARPTGRNELLLWRGADDPDPAVIARSCAVAALDLDVGLTGAAVAVRTGDDVTCARSHAVVHRASDTTETWWTTGDEIRQVAVAADRSGVVLALVTLRDEENVIVGNRIVELRGDGTARVRATLDGDHDLRAMWADDRDHAWLVGDRGVLLRFTGDRFVDRSAELGLISGATLRALAGTGPDDVFLSGDDSLLFHFDGRAWSAVSSPGELASFAALTIDATDVYISAGDRTLSLRAPRTPPVAPSCPL